MRRRRVLNLNSSDAAFGPSGNNAVVSSRKKNTVVGSFLKENMLRRRRKICRRQLSKDVGAVF